MSHRLSDVLREVSAALSAWGVGFALVDGLAVSVRSEPRFTRDVDLAVAVEDDEQAEGIVSALAPAYEPVAVVENETLERMAAVRLGRGHGTHAAGVVVDLLFASSGVEAEVVASAEPLEVFAGLQVPVARTGHLLAMKLLARADDRPLDAVDLQALLAVADPAELGQAEHLVDLIMQRGGNRGRDLRAQWQLLVADSG